ncbi:MAG: xanthine phosphoribosyltransferase [Clostridia bacterium]|nr:xanthine phosphoribosyltransferase [Clostridia bacterium]
MKALENKILKEGIVLNEEVLKVGSFLNQQLDPSFIMEMGDEIARIYNDEKITKILTIETSGIPIAFAAGTKLNCPIVFAKKTASSNVSGNVYKSSVYSFTHNKTYEIIVPCEYINKNDRVLIIDDFLANGKALLGLIEIVKQADAHLVGCTCAIEKGFQKGGDSLREQGFRIESLAIIDEMSPAGITFRCN